MDDIEKFLNQLSAVFEHMAYVQSQPYAVVRDENGMAIGVQREQHSMEQPLNVQVLDDSE